MDDTKELKQPEHLSNPIKNPHEAINTLPEKRTLLMDQRFILRFLEQQEMTPELKKRIAIRKLCNEPIKKPT